MNKVVEEDNKNCGCLSKELTATLEADLSSNIHKLVLNRAKKGFELSSKTAYYEHSIGLYKLVAKAL